jgi:hypothetical protein
MARFLQAFLQNATSISGGFPMKKFLMYFSLGTAVTVLTLAIGPPMYAQQSDQGPTPAQSTAAQQQQQNEAQMPSSGDTTTHEDQAFTGRITKENGALVLKDTATKVSYKLDDPAKAKQYVGKQVKVTGKLDMNTNTIEITGIEPIS